MKSGSIVLTLSKEAPLPFRRGHTSDKIDCQKSRLISSARRWQQAHDYASCLHDSQDHNHTVSDERTQPEQPHLASILRRRVQDARADIKLRWDG